MDNTFDEDIDSLPPLTKALRQVWVQPGPAQPTAPYPKSAAFHAILNAVHNLENRVTALETP